MTTQPTAIPSHVHQGHSESTSTCDWCRGLIWGAYWNVRFAGTWDEVCAACGDKRGWEVQA
jgi:hypothetical protein